MPTQLTGNEPRLGGDRKLATVEDLRAKYAVGTHWCIKSAPEAKTLVLVTDQNADNFGTLMVLKSLAVERHLKYGIQLGHATYDKTEGTGFMFIPWEELDNELTPTPLDAKEITNVSIGFRRAIEPGDY